MHKDDDFFDREIRKCNIEIVKYCLAIIIYIILFIIQILIIKYALVNQDLTFTQLSIYAVKKYWWSFILIIIVSILGHATKGDLYDR